MYLQKTFWGLNRPFWSQNGRIQKRRDTIQPIDVKFFKHVGTIKQTTCMVRYDVTSNPRWRTDGSLEIENTS